MVGKRIVVSVVATRSKLVTNLGSADCQKRWHFSKGKSVGDSVSRVAARHEG
jgi:hypothetical protein